MVAYILLLKACSFMGQSTEDYMSYFEEEKNGLRKEVILGDVAYDIQFKTPEYIVCKEGLEGKEKSERLERLKNTIWFNVSIKNSKENKSILGQQSERDALNYFLMSAENNFSIRSGDVVLKKVAYHVQNNQGVIPHDVLILGYKTEQRVKQGLEVTYNDKLFNKGELKVVIDQQALNNIPKLKG